MSRVTIDRREFLASGISLAGAGVLGASAISCFSDRTSGPMISDRSMKDASPPTARLDDDLREPAVISSVGGLLATAIVCETKPVRIAGRQVGQPVTYNGSFPGPTLWVRPGDLIDLRFSNRIVFDQAETRPGYGRPPRHANMTNLHYHGMHISPVGTADNMLIAVPAKGSYRYTFQVPHDHP